MLTYTITVENTGNVDLTNVVLTDDLADGTETLVSGDLNTNLILETDETWVYSATYNATQADINLGDDLVNTAIVDTDQTGPEQDDATTTITQGASLTVVKDVDIANISAPGLLTYTITVENTGNVDLTNVVLTDDLADGTETLVSGDLNTNLILETDETWVYSATYNATQADINLGDDLVNTAIVDTDQTGPEQDDATTTITQGASLTVVKDVDIANISAPGLLTYTITVENTGNVDLTNVVLTDDLADGTETLVSGDLNTNLILETDETWVYSATYNATQADINLGDDLVNTAIVDTDQTGPEQDDATTTITQGASLTVVKDVDIANISAPGLLTYTITVENTGNVDLTNVVLTDDLADGTETLVSGDLNTNLILETDETWVYSATYNATQADINLGDDLVNTAIVDTDQTGPEQDDATTTITQGASLTVVKDVDIANISAPGLLTYTITVENTGNVDLTNVVLTDDLADGTETLVSGDLNTNLILETDETWVYSATYNATQADINLGDDLVNTAIVDTDQTGPEQDDATTTITQGASLTVVKDVDIANISAPGLLTYTITVENTGNVDLTNVVLTDDLADGTETLVSGDLNTNLILETDETWVYSATYNATQADINLGDDLVNTAIVDTDQTGPEQDDATTTITQGASLTVVKDVDIANISAPGLLTYTITVENTGNVDLTNVVLTDDLADGTETLVSGDLNTNLILETDETWVYSATYNATQADINLGDDLVNTAIVDTDQTGPEQDDATTTITQGASLTVVKDVDIANISAPGLLTYTITVENTGNVDLTNVVLTDDLADGTETLVSGDLNTNLILETDETWVYSATYNATQADINLGDDLVNTAIVDTDQTGPEQDDATTTITQGASLTVVKDVDIANISAPGLLTYTITVENTGNVDLTNVVLTDDLADGTETLVSGDLNTNLILETDETWVYSATYNATQADINLGDDLVNTAIVDTDQTGPEQDDATTTITQGASLTVVKDVDIANISAPGLLTYTITVENTGNVDLTNVVLTDLPLSRM